MADSAPLFTVFENGVVLEVTQTQAVFKGFASQFENGVVLEVTQTAEVEKKESAGLRMGLFQR